MKIYVVDDDPMNRKYLHALLAQEGHSVIECEDGLATLERLETEPGDAIISDVLMPRMDGYRLCYEVRQRKALCDMPIVLYTSTCLSADDEKAALTMGADRYLRKPAPAEVILRTLHEVVHEGRARRGGKPGDSQDPSALREYSEALVRKLEQTNTQLTAANKALHESEERLRLAAAAGNIGMWEWNPATGELVWNDQQKLLLGFPEDTKPPTIEGFLQAIFAEDRDRVQRALRKAVADGAPYEAEYRVLRPDHTVRWISSKGRAYYDDGGQCVRVMGAALDVTRRKEADEALRKSESYFREMADSAPVMIWQTGPDGLCTYLNKQWFDFTGQTAAQGLGFGWLEAVHPEDRREAGLKFLQANERRAPFHAEYRLRRHDGEYRWAVDSAVPRLIPSGEFLGYIGSVVDFTDRKLAEEQHQKNLRLARALNEIAFAVASTMNRQGQLDVLLEKIETILPYPTVSSLRLFHPETGWLESLAQRGLDSTVWREREPGRTLHRALRVVESRAPVIVADIRGDAAARNQPMPSSFGLVSYADIPLIARGRVIGVLGVYSREFHEFTAEEVDFLTTVASHAAIAIHHAQLYADLEKSRNDLESANRALRETNRMLVALHAVAVAASQSTNLDRVLERAIEVITGIFEFEAARIHLYDEKSDIVMRRAAFERHPERFAATQTFKKGEGIVGSVIESGVPLIFEDIASDPRYAKISRTGIARRFNQRFYAVFPVRTKAQIFGTLSCLGTEPRKLSDSEIRLLEALTDQVAVAVENNKLYEDITLKVTDLQLKTAELEQANKVKDEFLGVVSHELRTPINVIMGYTTLFKDGVFGEIKPGQHEPLLKIRHESEVLLGMIDGILAATAVATDQAMLEIQEFRPDALLEELRANYAVTAPRHLVLDWNYPRDLPALKSDRTKFRHILDNIIGNAVKFTERGKVAVSAQVVYGPPQSPAAGASSAPWLEFKVTDTGVGIAADALSRIFEKFYQVDSSKTRQYGGIGMGLYIAKRLTEQLGGKIAVESTPGRGSAFTVHVPTAFRLSPTNGLSLEQL